MMNPHSNAARSDAAMQALMDAVLAEPKHQTQLSRRGFLKVAGMSGGLALVMALDVSKSAQAANSSVTTGKAWTANAYVEITPDNQVLLYSKGPEIGQGIKTAFALIIAEELDADWSQVRVAQAPINPALYGNQGAGGSTSIPNNWDVLRQAGAAARAMLVNAAAQTWSVPATTLKTQQGKVLAADGRSLTFGALAQRASTLAVPDAKELVLKERNQYQLLGKSFTGVDNRQVVTGQPLFGIDTRLPNMLYAAYHKCPAFGGSVKSANLEQIKSLPGVKDAFVVKGNGLATEVMPGIAIIATSTWAAFTARAQLQVTWDTSTASSDSWQAYQAQAEQLAQQPGASVLREQGDVSSQLAKGARRVDAFYSYPFIAHATLEPQNCTAWYHDNGIELWSPTQQATPSLRIIARLLELPEDRVVVHQTRVGGGFGRRLTNDYACEAALIAREVAARFNAPVKLTWSREDDFAHDLYRPAGFHAFSGAVDAQGRVAAWADHFITFTADGKGPAASANFDIEDFPGPLLDHYRLSQTMLKTSTPTGALRAPRSNGVAFAVQCFAHELAVAAGVDHRDFLLGIMGEPRWLTPGNIRAMHTGRAAAVIKLATEKAGWGRTLPKGRGLGLAFHFSHAGHVAQVVELSVDDRKRITLHKITVAADVGPIINMSGANAQSVGAVIDGLSMMLGQRITMEQGRVQETNFHEYPLLRMPYAPEVETHFIQSEFRPTGLGEPALPPLAPALCNAIYAASGVRIRSLPLSQHGYSLNTTHSNA